LGRILNFIKFLIDSNGGLPEPFALIDGSIGDRMDRHSIGVKLLQGFMHDGKIRGITPDGEIYEHTVSEELNHQFVEGLNKIQIRGYRSKGYSDFKV
jgi:hypothetical protein